MKKLLLAFLLLLSGCDGSFRNYVLEELNFPTQMDVELYHYLYEFQLEAKKYNVKLDDIDRLRTLQFGDPTLDNDSDTVGVCRYWYIGIPEYLVIEHWHEIIIQKPLVMDDQFKALVYHEFGHCLLDLDHTKNPSDIMYPWINPEQTRDLNKSIKKMFMTAKRLQSKK